MLTTKITSNKKTKKTKFTAKLLNSKGKPLKGKKITFKIKGKKYKVKTNKKGIASISIKLKLKKGTYKIYTIYGKSKVVNKPLPSDDPTQRKPDISLATKELGGWKPTVELRQGLSNTIEYFKGYVV